MAIKVSGTTVIDDTRDLVNIGSITAGSITQTHNVVNSASGTTTLDLDANTMHVINMVGNITLAFSNATAGQQGVIFLAQDATGTRSFTLPAACKTPNGGATISQVTTGSTTSILSYTVLDASNIYVNYIGNFA